MSAPLTTVCMKQRAGLRWVWKSFTAAFHAGNSTSEIFQILEIWRHILRTCVSWGRGKNQSSVQKISKRVFFHYFAFFPPPLTSYAARFFCLNLKDEAGTIISIFILSEANWRQRAIGNVCHTGIFQMSNKKMDFAGVKSAFFWNIWATRRKSNWLFRRRGTRRSLLMHKSCVIHQVVRESHRRSCSDRLVGSLWWTHGAAASLSSTFKDVALSVFRYINFLSHGLQSRHELTLSHLHPPTPRSADLARCWLLHPHVCCDRTETWQSRGGERSTWL